MAWWSSRKRRNRELDEEIQAHFDLALRDRIEQGETPTAAEQIVRREFGNLTLVKEATRDVWGYSGVQTVSQDLRYAVRSFVRTPIFTTVAVVSLTLAIGAMTAIASLLHALVFRPLPVRDPYSLVMIRAQPRPTLSGNLSFPVYRELTNDQQVFTSLVGFTGIAVFDVQTDGEFARAATMGVTANFYTEFDIRPFAGRLFAPDDFTTAPAPWAVLGFSFWKRTREIRAIDIGVQIRNVVVAYPTPRPGAYTAVDNDLYHRELVERVGSMSGVDAVGIMQLKPLGGSPPPWNIGPSESHDSVASVYSSASPGLFNALGIPLLQGRDFTWSDNSRSRLVAIVSRSLARRLFGDGNPVGREIRIVSDRELQHVEVVGLIADARVYDVKDTNLYAAYVPSLQRGSAANGKAIVIRGSVTMRDVSKAIEPLGREYVADMTSLADILDETLLQERLTAAVAGFFGVLALVLSAIGLYGLMAYSVIQRQREIGIRIALGAQVREILAGILIAGLKLATAGVLGGLVIAWATTTFVGSLLFNVQPLDPQTMALAPVLLLLVATAACLLPAYRAARVDPAIALRAN